MTMHLMHAGFTTTNTKPRTKKKTPAQLRAQAEHEAWLRKNGVHTDQIASRQTNTKRKVLKRVVEVDRTSECTNGFAPGGAKHSVFDSNWKDRYADDPLMAEREREALAKAEALKGRLMPLYNKGPVQLMPEGLKMTDLGKRRP